MKSNNGLRDFYILWVTQSLSQLGSAMTSFALTLWLYEKTGSALMMFLLGVAGVVLCLTAGQNLKRYHYSD